MPYSLVWKVEGAYSCQQNPHTLKLHTYLHRVLVFPGERVDSSLLNTLLALRQALVPAIKSVRDYYNRIAAT